MEVTVDQLERPVDTLAGEADFASLCAIIEARDSMRAPSGMRSHGWSIGDISV